MARHMLIESLEPRRLFAAVTLDAAAFYDACLVADTDGSQTLSAAEANAYANVIRAEIRTDTSAHRAALAQATRNSGTTLRDLAAQRKTDLAAAARADRPAINAAFVAAVKAEKDRARTEVATLRSEFAADLATSNATRNAFAALGRAFARPVNIDLNADRQLDLREGDQEFGALLARDGNGASLSPRDLANLNRR